MGRPTIGTKKAVQRILSYLSNTSGFKLGGVWGKKNIYQYNTDSGHSGDQPRTVRSQTGVMLRMNSVPVQSVNRRQPTSAKSPATADVYALSEGVELARRFQWCLQDLDEQERWPMEVLVDNNQATSFPGIPASGETSEAHSTSDDIG